MLNDAGCEVKLDKKMNCITSNSYLCISRLSNPQFKKPEGNLRHRQLKACNVTSLKVHSRLESLKRKKR